MITWLKSLFTSAVTPTLQGTNYPSNRVYLTPEQVVEIEQLLATKHVSTKELVQQYDVSATTIYTVRKRIHRYSTKEN